VLSNLPCRVIVVAEWRETAGRIVSEYFPPVGWGLFLAAFLTYGAQAAQNPTLTRIAQAVPPGYDITLLSALSWGVSSIVRALRRTVTTWRHRRISTPQLFGYAGFKWQHRITDAEVFVIGPLCAKCLASVVLNPGHDRWYCTAAGCKNAGRYAETAGEDLMGSVYGKAVAYYRRRGLMAFRHYPA
jgi:ribosomal protein S27AE